MMRLLRSGPAMTRSTASSTSFMEIAFLLRRAASSAAFVDHVREVGAREAGRSASEVPWKSTVCSIGLPVRAGSRSHRPSWSGCSTVMWRSKRPGRNRAGSRMSGRFVAPMRMPAAALVESVHLDEELVQGLLTLIGTAAFAATALAARCIQLVDEDDRGGERPALEEVTHSRGPHTYEGSTNSAPATEKKGTPASPATAFARSVLPQPGGPNSRTPFGGTGGPDLFVAATGSGGSPDLLQLAMASRRPRRRRTSGSSAGPCSRSCGGCVRTASRDPRRPASGS